MKAGADMSESKDYLDMIFHSIENFRNDVKIDANELGEVLEIAEWDGKIDHNEIRVLRSIITRLNPSEIDDAMRNRLLEISDKTNAIRD